MRNVLNNLVYDSDKARVVARYENMQDCGSPGYYRETLHQKKTGEFFIHGQGNSMSPYAEPKKSGWAAGEKIKPVTVATAKSWLEAHDPAKAERIFGPIHEHETGNRARLCTQIDEGLLKKLNRLAQKNGVSAMVMLENLIRKAE